MIVIAIFPLHDQTRSAVMSSQGKTVLQFFGSGKLMNQTKFWCRKNFSKMMATLWK